MMNKLFILFVVLTMLTSCSPSEPNKSTVIGSYERDFDKQDILIIKKDGSYIRIINSKDTISDSNWFYSDNNVFMKDWFNRNYKSISVDSITSVILNCRYNYDGECTVVEIGSDGEGYNKLN